MQSSPLLCRLPTACQRLASDLPAQLSGATQSCLSHTALPTGATCVDACAAPGNKTSHLAALMGNSGTIHAFDTDPHRLALLRRLTAKAGATSILPRHGSFLDAEPTDRDLAGVTHLLVDPSCSGSGMMAAPWFAHSSACVAAAVASKQAAAPTADSAAAGDAAGSGKSGGKTKRDERKRKRGEDSGGIGVVVPADEVEALEAGGEVSESKERVRQLADFQVNPSRSSGLPRDNWIRCICWPLYDVGQGGCPVRFGLGFCHLRFMQ